MMQQTRISIEPKFDLLLERVLIVSIDTKEEKSNLIVSLRNPLYNLIQDWGINNG